MTTNGGLQRRQQRQTLFACIRGQVATNASKGLGESLAPGATRDLLLDFDHAKISLSQIVGLSRQLHRLHL